VKEKIKLASGQDILVT